MMKQILLQDQNYQFGIAEGIGIENTPWKQFDVFIIPNSNADKYVVNIKFKTDMPDFNGQPVEYQIFEIEVDYFGYNTNKDGQTVTEYIETLKAAEEFVEKIQKWFRENKNLDIPFINK